MSLISESDQTFIERTGIVSKYNLTTTENHCIYNMIHNTTTSHAPYGRRIKQFVRSCNKYTHNNPNMSINNILDAICKGKSGIFRICNQYNCKDLKITKFLDSFLGKPFEFQARIYTDIEHPGIRQNIQNILATYTYFAMSRLFVVINFMISTKSVNNNYCQTLLSNSYSCECTIDNDKIVSICRDNDTEDDFITAARGGDPSSGYYLRNLNDDALRELYICNKKLLHFFDTKSKSDILNLRRSIPDLDLIICQNTASNDIFKIFRNQTDVLMLYNIINELESNMDNDNGGEILDLVTEIKVIKNDRYVIEI